ncbi:unnamed protein product [Calypogeia fissa]
MPNMLAGAGLEEHRTLSTGIWRRYERMIGYLMVFFVCRDVWAVGVTHLTGRIWNSDEEGVSSCVLSGKERRCATEKADNSNCRQDRRDWGGMDRLIGGGGGTRPLLL